jgi:dolichol-phosphate mannosyltransferase
MNPSRPLQDWPRSTDIVVPLYEEARGLPSLIEALGPILDEIPSATLCLVDDGSLDGSADLAETLCRDRISISWKVLRHRRNYGLSRALRTAFAAGRGEAVCWLDADLSYEAAVLPRLLSALSDGADLALASPYGPGGSTEGVPTFRLLLSRGLSRSYRLLYSRQIHTWSSMVRAWRRPLLATCLPEREGHLGVVESLVRAVERQARIVELPACLRGRVAGSSGLKVLPTVCRHIGLLGEASLGRLEHRA